MGGAISRAVDSPTRTVGKTAVQAFAAAYHAAGDKRIIEDYYPTNAQGKLLQNGMYHNLHAHGAGNVSEARKYRGYKRRSKLQSTRLAENESWMAEVMMKRVIQFHFKYYVVESKTYPRYRKRGVQFRLLQISTNDLNYRIIKHNSA